MNNPPEILPQSLNGVNLTQAITDRFWSKVSQADGCWIWTDKPDPQGYGRLGVSQSKHQRKNLAAHRLAFTLSNGPIPDGHSVCHSCDTPLCCNPTHLFAGTHQENSTDMIGKGRSLKGEAHPRSKLSEAQVREIRTLYSLGALRSVLLVQFKVSKSQIQRIVQHEKWKHSA